MEYEGRICRASVERGSFMLPVTAGCAYNRCLFCGLFKDIKYRELTDDEIFRELKRVKSLGADPEVVYLGDGNAFHLSYCRLKYLAEILHREFPALSEIHMDSTIPDIRSKTDEELKALNELGINRLYIGIESGLDDVLCAMKKCHTKDMALFELERLRKAGIGYGAHVMCGIAGKGRGEENALALADFLNRTKPVVTVNFSLFTGCLTGEISKGRFERASEKETILEDLTLIENIKVPMQYESHHDNYSESTRFSLRGSLPKDKERFCERLKTAAERIESIERSRK